MKQFALVVLIIFALVNFVSGQKSQPRKNDLKRTLMALEKRSWEAWKNHDGKFFKQFLSEDHVEVGFGGVTNKATVVTGVASPVCVVKTYAIDKFELVRFGRKHCPAYVPCRTGYNLQRPGCAQSGLGQLALPKTRWPLAECSIPTDSDTKVDTPVRPHVE